MEGLGPTARFEAQLPAELASVVAARRLVERAARDWRLSSPIAEDITLLASELVTNAIIHARTDVTVRVQRLGSGVRLEVADDDKRLPVVDVDQPEDLLATRSMTGRGLAVVAAVSDRWGANPAGSRGKLVWAEIGTGMRRASPVAAPVAAPPQGIFIGQPALAPSARLVPDAGRPRVTLEAMEVGQTAGPIVEPVVAHAMAVAAEGKRIHLIGVPVRLLVESQRQFADLQREMIVMGMDRDATSRGDTLAEGGREMSVTLDCFRRMGSNEAHAALARGDELVDFDLIVSDEQISSFERIAGRLRSLGRMVKLGRLLTMPPSDEVAAYRRWYHDEVTAQLAGRPPRPYPG
jgi:anti-sigma regulatory factor (Ser/Thr protein kinase)